MNRKRNLEPAYPKLFHSRFFFSIGSHAISRMSIWHRDVAKFCRVASRRRISTCSLSLAQTSHPLPSKGFRAHANHFNSLHTLIKHQTHETRCYIPKRQSFSLVVIRTVRTFEYFIASIPFPLDKGARNLANFDTHRFWFTSKTSSYHAFFEAPTCNNKY